jgi:hypothetical protein
MGRPVSTTSEKTGIYLNERLKLRASLWAMRHGMTLSEMVSAALTYFMREHAATSKRSHEPEQIELPGEASGDSIQRDDDLPEPGSSPSQGGDRRAAFRARERSQE